MHFPAAEFYDSERQPIILAIWLEEDEISTIIFELINYRFKR